VIKTAYFFMLVWFLVFLFITLFRAATKKQKWSIAKAVAHSAAYAVVAMLIVVFVVFVF